MTDYLDLPFSRRMSESEPRIRDRFPEKARIALVHTFSGFVRDKYVEGWQAILREAQRIARVPLSQCQALSDDEVPVALENILRDLYWSKIYDLCERVWLRHAIQTYRWVEIEQYAIPDKSVADVQFEMEKEIQNLFNEENLDYNFVNGRAVRATTSHTADQADRAHVALTDGRLQEARGHFRKALSFFRDVENPDYRNVVKEAVCAVEAAARALFPGTGDTLGKIVGQLKRDGTMPSAVGQCFDGTYAFRNSGKGVAHGEATGGETTRSIAEFVVASAASQILFLAALYEESQDIAVPF